MPTLNETFTEEEFTKLTQKKLDFSSKQGKDINWHDFIMAMAIQFKALSKNGEKK